MGSFRVFIFLILYSLGCSTMLIAGALSLKEIETVKGPITLREVEARFGKGWKHCHGPCIWYESKDYPNKEYWFWLLPSDRGIDFEDGQVAFVTLVNAEDPDDFEIIWPQELKNKDKQEVFKSYDKRLKEEAETYKHLEKKGKK